MKKLQCIMLAVLMLLPAMASAETVCTPYLCLTAAEMGFDLEAYFAALPRISMTWDGEGFSIPDGEQFKSVTATQTDGKTIPGEKDGSIWRIPVRQGELREFNVCRNGLSTIMCNPDGLIYYTPFQVEGLTVSFSGPMDNIDACTWHVTMPEDADVPYDLVNFSWSGDLELYRYTASEEVSIDGTSYQVVLEYRPQKINFALVEQDDQYVITAQMAEGSTLHSISLMHNGVKTYTNAGYGWYLMVYNESGDPRGSRKTDAPVPFAGMDMDDLAALYPPLPIGS